MMLHSVKQSPRDEVGGISGSSISPSLTGLRREAGGFFGMIRLMVLIGFLSIAMVACESGSNGNGNGNSDPGGIVDDDDNDSDNEDGDDESDEDGSGDDTEEQAVVPNSYCPLLDIDAVTASDEAAGHSADNAIDGYLSSYWAAEGPGSSITLDLGAEAIICAINIAWFEGDEWSYGFSISSSRDGSQFVQVYPAEPGEFAESSGENDGFEEYEIHASGRYLRVTVDGSSQDDWARISAVGMSGSVLDLPAPTTIIEVSDISQLQASIDAAVPGDHIILADGSYELNDILDIQSKAGTAETPIVIRADRVGGSVISGDAGFRIRQSEHIVVFGFDLQHAIWGGDQDNNNRNGNAFEIRSSRHIRVSRNAFNIQDTTERSFWLLITGVGSERNRVDYNSFGVKESTNVFLAIYGSTSEGDPAMSRMDLIERNHFHDQISFDISECIRIGDSSRGLISSYTRVQENLFERCVSDHEVVSNKSSDNLYLANTFRDNDGSLTLRHGNRNTVDGNFFINNVGGIRLYGHDHFLVNNYFEGNTGTGARSTLVLNSGNAEVDTGSGEHAARPKRVTVAFNTFIDNTQTHLVIGAATDQRPLAPEDSIVENNIIQGESGELVSFVREPIDFTWGGNILWGEAEDGDMPSYGYTRVDPLLARAEDQLFRIEPDSPAVGGAINSLMYGFVTSDMDGHARPGSGKDIGAEQWYPDPPLRRPLYPRDVGPFAP